MAQEVHKFKSIKFILNSCSLCHSKGKLGLALDGDNYVYLKVHKKETISLENQKAKHKS